ncbi:response regulator [Leptolyngbya sp. 7M]|nr:response regulator [Leptolyngbya sp. 7M]
MHAGKRQSGQRSEEWLDGQELDLRMSLSKFMNPIDYRAIFNACAHPDVRRPGHLGRDLAGSLWTLRQDLESVLRAGVHDAEHGPDELQGHILMEQITHRVHEDDLGRSPRKRARITVTDTGKGIVPEFLPYVFDYFRQEDGTTTRRFGGLGLGLAIVRHITELHGGTVWAESLGEGLGATFTVQLPLMTSSGSVDQQEESPMMANLTGLKVLAVDDDADIRELIEFILQQAGAEVRVVASAVEVLQQLDLFAPDLLICDIGMPEMDGYMLMRQIRDRQIGQATGQFPQTLPKAIALTAYAGELDQQQALAAGFQLHLAKPVEPEQLIRAIVTLT